MCLDSGEKAFRKEKLRDRGLYCVLSSRRIMRLLVAEDNQELALILKEILEENYYSVDVVYNGIDALDWGVCTEYDGIILDVVMPGMSGLEVVRLLRKKNCNVPVLFLTGRGETRDRVLGLNAGADDYLSKPFATEELLARIRAMTRRRKEFLGDLLELEGVTLDRKSFELTYQNKTLGLRNKEYQIMELLMRNPKQYISADRLIDRIWGYDTESETNVVWVNISTLRKRLIHLKAPLQIKSIRGIGYRIESAETIS